jgi:hypothetical protein
MHIFLGLNTNYEVIQQSEAYGYSGVLIIRWSLPVLVCGRNKCVRRRRSGADLRSCCDEFVLLAVEGRLNFDACKAVNLS